MTPGSPLMISGAAFPAALIATCEVDFLVVAGAGVASGTRCWPIVADGVFVGLAETQVGFSGTRCAPAVMDDELALVFGAGCVGRAEVQVGLSALAHSALPTSNKIAHTVYSFMRYSPI